MKVGKDKEEKHVSELHSLTPKHQWPIELTPTYTILNLFIYGNKIWSE